MEKAELVSTLSGLVGKYEQHRHYIDKASAQAASGKFSKAVVEKVILDHEIKSSDVADQANPLVPQIDDMIGGYESEKAKIAEGKAAFDEQISELELRSAIGEMSEADFEGQVSGLRERVVGDNARIAEIDADLGDLRDVRKRWADIAGPNGHFTDPRPAAPEEAVGEHVEKHELKEDLSAVFGSDSGAASVRVTVEEEVAIEAAEGADEGGDDAQDMKFAEAAGAEVEIEIAAESSSADGGADGKADGASQRRALLLYQEGTAEEQHHPFTGSQITIGRGRENDIQIKNDSKVSRYHCKIFRRGNNFYIEDIKSSNGTLVNGELITDRRLFGGEEIIVGETFFRFRLME